MKLEFSTSLSIEDSSGACAHAGYSYQTWCYAEVGDTQCIS